MIDFTPVLQALIGVAATLVAVFGGYLAIKAKGFVASKTTLEERAAMRQWIKDGVNAAEQLFGSGQGPDKKAYVLDLMKDKCISGSCDLSQDAINALIESEVLALKEKEGKNE